MDLKRNFKAALVTLFVAAFGLISCDKEDNGLVIAPSLTLSSTAASQMAGEKVRTTAKIEAPGGAKNLTILKNGADFEVIEFNGEESVEYQLEYVVEDLPIGTKVNFTFEAEDKNDKKSSRQTFTVTVSETPAKEIVEVSGNLETQTWTNDKIYRLNGYVRVQEGKVLTIEPGTIVIGDTESKGTLIVQMGGKIMAEGTADEPIVFTSEKGPGQRVPGDWGGVVLCGKAKNNATQATGKSVELEGNYGAFHGGSDDNDDSGILKYARIEYAGIPINPNEEVNSLTMGSVGSKTVTEYIMCSYGLDDAFEWFGGKNDGKYLIAYRGLDDDFDVDLGYSGNVQFGLGIRAAKAADQSGSNGFEVDNDGGGNLIEPFTSGSFSNMTIIGPKKVRETSIANEFQHAMQLRRSNKLKIYNSFFTGYPWGLFIDGNNTANHCTNDELQLRNIILAGVKDWGTNGYGKGHPGKEPNGEDMKTNATNGFDVRAWFEKAEYNNKSIATWVEAGIDGSLFDLGTPKVTLKSGSMLSNGAKWDNVPNAAKFEQVSFIGAFGDQDWTAGWAAWDAATRDYGVNQ
jgi:hypothetical protein